MTSFAPGDLRSLVGRHRRRLRGGAPRRRCRLLPEFVHPAAPDDGGGALRPADLWIYGHTHESFDAVVGGETRVVSNAKGYGPWPGQQRTWDNPDFDEKLIIEI